MQTPPRPRNSPEPQPTRQRLLDAAFRVCSERGLHGATTREIADAARVNEVTLFRHFGSKEKLIAAVFSRSVEAQAEALAINDPDGKDLSSDLLCYARRFSKMLFEHEALIRTIIAEARRHPEQARQVIGDSAKPLRERLVAYLRAAQKTGSVRRGLALRSMVDAFTGMLLAGMLRRTSPALDLDYSQEEYLAGCVELFLRGIAAPDKSSKAKRR